MKKVWNAMAGILLATLACGTIFPATVPAQPGVETIVAQTMQALTTTAPTESQAQSVEPTAAQGTQFNGIPVSFGNISFIIPNGMAAGAGAEVVPAVEDDSGASWDVAPQYSKITLQEYTLSGKFFEPHIRIYPAPEYEAASQGAAESLARLRAILAAPQAPISTDALPILPFANAAQVFGAQVKVMNFQNGSGVRFLTEYAQYFAAINNHDMFYHFQGLTGDGKYYIIAILPANASFLAADPDYAAPIPADGIPFPQNLEDTSAMDDYYHAITAKLNATPAEGFAPGLDLLDALIGSINIVSQ